MPHWKEVVVTEFTVRFVVVPSSDKPSCLPAGFQAHWPFVIPPPRAVPLGMNWYMLFGRGDSPAIVDSVAHHVP